MDPSHHLVMNNSYAVNALEKMRKNAFKSENEPG
jgi:hypothetical protein